MCKGSNHECKEGSETEGWSKVNLSMGSWVKGWMKEEKALCQGKDPMTRVVELKRKGEKPDNVSCFSSKVKTLKNWNWCGMSCT